MAASADDLLTQPTFLSRTLVQPLVETRSYQPWDLIWKHGSQDDELFVIEQGRFSAALSLPASPEVYDLPPLGRVFASVSLRSSPGAATARDIVADEQGSCLVLSRAAFEMRASQEAIRGRPWN